MPYRRTTTSWSKGFLFAALVVLVIVVVPARGSATGRSGGPTKCRAVATTHASADGIRVRHADCKLGRTVAKTFISRLQCKLQRQCTVVGFDCATPETGSEDVSVFREHCARGKEKRVAFTAHV
jgi:hypothetical protein